MRSTKPTWLPRYHSLGHGQAIEWRQKGGTLWKPGKWDSERNGVVAGSEFIRALDLAEWRYA